MNLEPAPNDDRDTDEATLEAVETMAMDALNDATTPRPEVADAEIRDVDDPMVGRRVGAYRLMARIGGGGMGTVYRAERAEGFAQRVAVRLIPRGMDSEAIVRRFRNEIKLQAAIGAHPNIAGLIDAGTVDDGRPYFVMEYVDGIRIDEYCDAHRLDIPARLRLFSQVCDALEFAHRHAVLHRDLRPSNILVDSDGVPKLIDFGIARLIDPGAEAVEEPTALGERVLTPEYASPEQVLGEPLTTASDVHALGVVLYQLLTGRWPYRLRTRTLDEVCQAICEQAAERPGAAVRPRRRPKGAPPDEAIPKPDPKEVAAARGTTPGRLARALAGDLDAIVLMAIRKEPERRYDSAGQLADDLRAHLDGRPVRARGDSTRYRAGKFVRRHTRALAAAVALVLAMAVGIVGTTRGLLMERRERERAEESSREARHAVDRFLTRVDEEVLLDQPGMHPLRKSMLRDVGAFYERFLAERSGDPAFRVDAAEARRRLARITAVVGSPAEADEGFRGAVAAWDELLASDPKDPHFQEELATTLNDWAAILMRMEGRRDDAEANCRRALGLIRSSLDADPPSASRRQLLGQVLQNTALVQFERGRLDRAIATLQGVLDVEGKLAAEDPEAIQPRIVMSRAHALMAMILERRGEMAAELASYEEAVSLLEAITKDRPELAEQTYRLAITLGDLGTAQQFAGKLDSALATGRRATAVLEQLIRRFPDVPEYREGLARSYNMLSELHRYRGEPEESLALAEKARPMLEQMVKEYPEDTSSRVALSKSYNNIGRIQQQSGDAPEALKSFRRAVDLFEATPGLGARDQYSLARNLSLCIPLIGAKPGSQGESDEDLISQADRVRRRIYGDRAIEVLREAVRGGFPDAEVLRSDPDLAAIRGRDDFRKIVAEVEEPAEEQE